MKDQQLIESFVYSKWHELGEGGFMTWLVSFMIKPRADQKVEYFAWIEDQKARTQATIAALDAQKIAAQDKLNTDLAKLTAEVAV